MKKETQPLETIEIHLTFYAVRSKDKKWFRAKGYGGGGNSWVDDIKKAKIYGRIGPARSCVTWWANNYPDFGVPDLIEIVAGEARVLDEKSRVQSAVHKKKLEEHKKQIYRLESKISVAQRKLNYSTTAAIQSEIDKLKKELDMLKNAQITTSI